jgi:hypothetical protein
MVNLIRQARSCFLAKRKRPLFALAAGLLSLSACDSVLSPTSERASPGSGDFKASVVHPEPRAPKLLVQTPQYPAAVLYILYREYLHKNPGLTSLSPEDKHYQQYLERRLRQLYPHEGYSGMMRDAVEEMRRQRQAWATYEHEYAVWTQSVNPFCQDPSVDPNCTTVPTAEDPTVDPSWDGHEEHAVPPDEMVPTLQMEIDTLQMDQPEIDQLYYQESLADGSFFHKRGELIVTTSTGQRATLDDLIRAAGEGWTPPGTAPADGEVTVQVVSPVVAGVLVGLGVIGWKGYRAKQAADRAFQKSTEYYGSQAESSTKRDAHRHIFWNMQMRRHVGSFMAKQIADGHESTGGGYPGDRMMDLHNNDIGRSIKYENFRGHWLWDRWDWKEWAEKVRNYINYAPNAEYIPEWQDQQNLTLQAAQAREQLVPDAKYIYFEQ